MLEAQWLFSVLSGRVARQNEERGARVLNVDGDYIDSGMEPSCSKEKIGLRLV
jgi:hypothetical protein